MKAADNHFLSRPPFLACTLSRTNLSLACTLSCSRVRVLSLALSRACTLSRRRFHYAFHSTLFTPSLPPPFPLSRTCVFQVAPNENSLPHPFLDDNGINPVYQKDSVYCVSVRFTYSLFMDICTYICVYLHTRRTRYVVLCCVSVRFIFCCHHNYSWIYVHTYVYIHTYVHIHTPEGLGMLCVWHMCILYQITNSHTYIHRHIYSHTYTHICIYIYIYTY